jgi:hypothetical protein
MQKTLAILIVLAALHLLGLAAYFGILARHDTGRSLYEELLDVDFRVFPAVFIAGWALITVLVLLRRGLFDGTTRVPVTLSIGICVVLALFAAGAVSLVPSGLQMFSEFGADLPTPTLFVMETYPGWVALPVLGVVLAVLVTRYARPAAPAAKLAFGGLIGLLVLANLSMSAVMGSMFLPLFKLCGPVELATGYTRLHAAAMLGRKDSVLRLVGRGAPVDAPTGDGMTPFYVAMQGAHLEVAQALVARGASVNTVTEEGMSPLHAAVARGSVQSVSWLLDNGAQVNSPKHVMRSPLHIAAGRDSAELAALLLKKGADVNAEDSQGKTPLDWASEFKQSKMAQLLIDRGGVRSTEESRRARTAQLGTQQARSGSSHSCGNV